jgi:Cof subfamily protein (haloacid dehalogenase superfamily)
VSGRPPRFVRPLLAQYQLDLPFASYNGAAIFATPQASEPIYHQPLDTATVLAIVAGLRQYAPELNLQIEAGDHMYADRIDEAMAERMRLNTIIAPPRKLGPLEQQLAADDSLITMKLLTFVGRERMAEAIAYVNGLGHGVYATTSGRGLLEIMAAGVDKAKAAAWWAAQLGFTAPQVIAFGDELNDIPLLKWAALGVAVANAQPQVLQAADYITASNDDDGVAQVIEKISAG